MQPCGSKGRRAMLRGGDGGRPRDHNDITASNSQPSSSNSNTKKILLPIPSPRPKSVTKKKKEIVVPGRSHSTTRRHVKGRSPATSPPQFAPSVPSVPVDTRFAASRIQLSRKPPPEWYSLLAKWLSVCWSVGLGWWCSVAGAWFGWCRSVVLGLAGSVVGESVAVVRSGMVVSVVSVVSAPRVVGRRSPVGRAKVKMAGDGRRSLSKDVAGGRKKGGSSGGEEVFLYPSGGLKTFWKVGQQHR